MEALRASLAAAKADAPEAKKRTARPKRAAAKS
jgi:hypothetical protein